jgi:hypothetical protein
MVLSLAVHGDKYIAWKMSIERQANDNIVMINDGQRFTVCSSNDFRGGQESFISPLLRSQVDLKQLGHDSSA